MARRPQANRAARAGLARGLDERRLRRNAGKQALSRLEIGEGLELDSRSRLAVASTGGASVAAKEQVPALPTFQDDTKAVPSDFRVSGLTSTTEPTALNLTQLQLLQAEIEVFLEEARENFATLTKRVNEISKRM